MSTEQMVGLSFKEMQAMETTHVCAECGGILVTVWDGMEYQLCCGHNKKHTSWRRIRREKMKEHIIPYKLSREGEIK